MTSRKILTKWLNCVISSKALHFLPLKYKWIKIELVYQFYITMKLKGEAPPFISHHSFIHTIRRISEMNQFIFTERKTIETSKAMYMLILENKKSNKQITDYSIFNGPLNGLLFSPATPSPPPTTVPLSKVTPSIQHHDNSQDPYCSTSITVHYTGDKPSLSTIQKNNYEEGQVMDPLNLLAEIAASSPNHSNTTNNNNDNQDNTIIQYNNDDDIQHDPNIPNIQHNPNNPNIQPINPNIQPIILNHPIIDSDFINLLPQLNMTIQPRLHPISLKPITMKHSSTKTARKATRWAILMTLLDCGYNAMTTNKRKELVNAVATYYSYIEGYCDVICSFSTFRRWHQSYLDSRRNGELVKMFEENRGAYKLPYTTELERQFPGFLHECYRYSTSIAGSDAQLDTILVLMQEYAKSEFHHCPIRSCLSMSKFHFYTFFSIFNGKYQSPTTKPRLTTKHIEARLDWALHWNKLSRLPNSKKHLVFLDEKWFYTSSRRRKQRILPPHPLTERSEDAFVAKKKVRSRRFPTKVMFQGIITKPYPEHGFNGQIALKRVSKPYKTKKLSFNKKFDDSYHITNLLKDNEWRYTCTIDRKTPLQEVIDDIQHIYGLQDTIAENLCFSYYTFDKKARKKKIKRMYMGENGEGSCTSLLGNKKIIDKEGQKQLLTLEDIELHVRVPKGTEIEKDTTCDSKFMLSSVDETGNSIRSALKWIPHSDTIFLFMDNAGGHGTDDIKKEYVSILASKYNIEVIWQVPNSPETNLLDLGYWATHQAIVERLHRLKRMEVEALARTVRDSFLLVEADKISKIFERWQLVLTLIIKGNGTNDLVESKRCLTKSLAIVDDLDRYALMN
jgi:hypothetical protein